MSTLKPVRARDRVFKAVRQRLITGSHRPGEKIKIRPLAEVLGTSTTPVREALLQLVVAGALQDDPQHSIRVPVLTADEYAELIHLRTIIECDIAVIAASRITSDELEYLEALALELLDQNFKTGLIADFHFALYRAAKMPLAMPLIEGLWLRTGPYLHYFEGADALKWGRRLRGDMLRGLRTGDAELVRSSLAEDLGRARDFIVNAINGNPQVEKPVRRRRKRPAEHTEMANEIGRERRKTA